MADVYKWVFANITPSEVNPQKRVDADRVMANFYAVRDLIFGRKALGVNAVDAGSTDTLCRVTIKTADANLGIVKNGDYVEVSDPIAGDKWAFVATADDIAEFDKNDQVTGVLKEHNYNDGGWLDGLEFRVVPFRSVVKAGDFATLGADKVTADSLPYTTPGGDTIYDKLSTAISTLAGVADPSGLLAGVVGSDQIAADAFAQNSPARNLVRNGGMEYGPSYLGGAGGGGGTPDGTAAPYGWGAYSGASACYATDGTVYRGNYALAFTGANDDDGAEGELIPEFDVTQYRGKNMILTAWVNAPADDIVKLGINSGHAGTALWGSAGGTAGEWVQLRYAFTVDAAETSLTVLVALAAAGAYTVYVDNVQLVEGTMAYDYCPSAWEVAVVTARETGFRNYLINGDFQLWHNGSALPPTGWCATGTATVAQNTVESKSGDFSADVTLGPGDSFYQLFGYLPSNAIMCSAQGQYVTAALWIKLTSGAGPVDIALALVGSGGSTRRTISITPAASWGRYFITALAPDDCYTGHVGIENNTGASFTVTISEIVAAVSPVPPARSLPSFFRLETMTWSLPTDPMGPSDLYHQGVLLPVRPGRYMIPLAIDVRQSVVTGGSGVNAYTVYIGGVPTQAVSIPAGVAEGSYSDGAPLITWRAAPDSSVKVAMTSYSGLYMGSAVASVTFLTWDG